VKKVRDACLEGDPYGFNTDRALEVARECLPDADEWRCGNCLYYSNCRLFPKPPEKDSPLALCCDYFTPRARGGGRSRSKGEEGSPQRRREEEEQDWDIDEEEDDWWERWEDLEEGEEEWWEE
jgi:hypothetical protein